MTASDADILHLRDLAAFDTAIHRLYGDGLLSEQTMSRVWSVVHREAWAMRKIGGMEGTNVDDSNDQSFECA